VVRPARNPLQAEVDIGSQAPQPSAPFSSKPDFAISQREVQIHHCCGRKFTPRDIAIQKPEDDFARLEP
jgi:hypothetical protein